MKLLSQTRYVASGALAAAVVIPLTGSALVTTDLGNIINQLPNNSMVRISVLSAYVVTDAGGASKLTIQSAAIVTTNEGVSAPLFSGQPLGLANRAAFQGELRFRDTDLTNPAAVDVQLQLTVANPDSSAHDVNSFNVNLAVEIATFDAPVYADGIIGIQ